MKLKSHHLLFLIHRNLAHPFVSKFEMSVNLCTEALVGLSLQ